MSHTLLLRLVWPRIAKHLQEIQRVRDARTSVATAEQLCVCRPHAVHKLMPPGWDLRMALCRVRRVPKIPHGLAELQVNPQGTLEGANHLRQIAIHHALDAMPSPSHSIDLGCEVVCVVHKGLGLQAAGGLKPPVQTVGGEQLLHRPVQENDSEIRGGLAGRLGYPTHLRVKPVSSVLMRRQANPMSHGAAERVRPSEPHVEQADSSVLEALESRDHLAVPWLPVPLTTVRAVPGGWHDEILDIEARSAVELLPKQHKKVMASALEAGREENPGNRFFVVAGAADAGEMLLCWHVLCSIINASGVNFFL